MKNQKVWLITGASKGMGLELTKYALSLGHSVAATSRNTEDFKVTITENQNNFLPLQVDITSDESVRSAVAQVVDRFGHIDYVVNNAGYSLVGSMEETSDQEFRQALDVNLFGAVHVIRAVLPFLREQQSGHIINISSNAGYVGFANASSYCASKFALVGISETLDQEVAPFGIKVTVVAPGQFRTSFMEKGSMTFAKNKIDVYKTAEAEEKWRSFSGQQTGDPQKLVVILVDITEMQSPPLHLLLGPDTLELITAHRQLEQQEIEAWKHLTLSTNFDKE